MAESVTTQEALQKLDHQLQCPLCFETFNQPKLLPCFHVFCKDCLEKLVARNGKSLICPTCRHIVPLSEKGVPGLQSDFHIDYLFEIRDAFSKASEPSDTQPGDYVNGKTTEYRQNCKEFLCNECQTAHKRTKQIDTAQATNSVTPQNAVPHCPKHPENALKIYCETCSELICNECIICLHKHHDYELVADVLPKHKKELVSSLKPVRETLGKVQKVLKDFETRAKEINDQRATLEANIHRKIDLRLQLLNQRRTELVDELEILTKQKLKSLAAQRGQVEIIQVKLASCVEYIEGVTDETLLMTNASLIARIEQISANFDPNTLQPETKANLKLATEREEQLSNFSEFLGIDDGKTFSIEHSHTTGDGLKGAKAGEESTVVFQAMTKFGNEYDGRLNLTAELIHIKSRDKQECRVSKEQNGRYRISYRPVSRGKHSLSLIVNEHLIVPHIILPGIGQSQPQYPVQGSPFPIVVELSSQCKPFEVIQGVSYCSPTPGMSYPKGIAVNSKGQIIVLHHWGESASILTPWGDDMITFGSKGSKKHFKSAFGVTVDAQDNIYITEYGHHRIQKFNCDGEFVAAVGNRGGGQLHFDGPDGICYNYRDNNLYICDNHNHRIQVLTTDLKFVRYFGNQENGPGELCKPYDIAFDNINNLYIADLYNNRVAVFTAEGQFLRAFSQKADGQTLIKPCAIAIDSTNTVYVSEGGPHYVSVFTCQGDYITTFGSKGSKEGEFNGIYGISVDHSNSIIVSDCNNCRLQIY